MSWTTQVSQHQKGKTNLDLLEQAKVSGSGISWTICKYASWPRHITMPATHYSVFVQAGCSSCHPTNSVKALKDNTEDIKCWKCGFSFSGIHLLTLTDWLSFASTHYINYMHISYIYANILKYIYNTYQCCRTIGRDCLDKHPSSIFIDLYFFDRKPKTTFTLQNHSCNLNKLI